MASELARPVPDLRNDLSLESTSSTVRRYECRSGPGERSARHSRADTCRRATDARGTSKPNLSGADGRFASGTRQPAITPVSVRLALPQSRLSATLQPLSGLAALTGAAVEPVSGSYVMAHPWMSKHPSVRRSRLRSSSVWWRSSGCCGNGRRGTLP
jgi:hypothetical protein